jgi:hypothetical protein
MLASFRRPRAALRAPRSFRPRLEFLEDRLTPSHGWYYTVTNANDSGAGSLRQAILDANNDTAMFPTGVINPDLIQFAIPQPPFALGTPRINLLSPLPAIVDDVWIVGETEFLPPQGGPGLPELPPSPPGIELNGAMAGPGATGLIITQPSSLVSGVVINGFSADGLLVNNGADSVYLRDSSIGTDVFGLHPIGNGGNGVLWAGNNGFIGAFPQAINPTLFLPRGGIILPGMAPYVLPQIVGMDNSTNIMAANGRDGILLTGNGNLVAGNFIGTVPSFAAHFGNGRNGVHVNGGNNNSIGHTVGGQDARLGNTISFNGPAQPGPGTGDGVLVDAGGQGNTITDDSLVGNTHLPIELLNNGNLAQAAPSWAQVTAVAPEGANGLRIDGLVGGTPNSDYIVDVYVDRVVLDNAGNVRNGVFLGSVNAHIGALGSGAGVFRLDVVRPISGTLTGLFSATATDPGGNTSQFGPALAGAKLSLIEGQVFLDANGNARHDPAESGLNGWTVELLNETGQVVRHVQTQTLDLNGDGRADPLTERGGYQFANLLPNHHYTVREVLQAGAQQTAPAAPGVYVFNPVGGQQITGADFGDIVTTPTVQSVVINDGAAQRSLVTKITVTFSTQVTIDPGAFQLIQSVRMAGGRFAVGNEASNLLKVAVSLVNGQTVATLTFAGVDPFGHPVIGGSLPDGRYTLNIVGNHIHDAVSGAPLDGNSNAWLGTHPLDKFFRLFGDANGDGRVDNPDLAALRRALGSKKGMPRYRAFFDFNGDGLINGVDAFQFRRRLGTHS